MQLDRSLLFVPANRERMLARAGTSGAGAIILDLEDSVPPAEKKAARRLARVALQQLARDGCTVLVRVNAAASGLARDDLMAVVRKGLAGIVVPKAEHPQDLRDIDVLLREAEMANKVRPGDVAMIPIIESPLALLRCEAIALASDRVTALAIGGEDFSAAMGITREADGAGIAHLRHVVATVAAAYGMTAIDAPYTDIGDAKGLAADTAAAKAIGMKAKFAIHPGQVAAINRAFAPTRAELAAARRVIVAAERAAAAGEGSVSVDGRMVDAPVVARARDVLARGERAASTARARKNA